MTRLSFPLVEALTHLILIAVLVVITLQFCHQILALPHREINDKLHRFFFPHGGSYTHIQALCRKRPPPSLITVLPPDDGTATDIAD